MKIVYINSFYAPEEVGGAEKSVRFLAEQMVKRGHEAHVLCLGREASSTELNGVHIHRLPVQNLYHPADAGQKAAWQKMVWHGVDSYNLMAASKVGQWLDRIRPDVVHTNTLAGFSVAVWREVKVRDIHLVHTLRDYYLICPNTAMFKDGKQCGARCLSCKTLSLPRRYSPYDPDVVVGNSDFILNKHKALEYFPASQGCTIYNAYEPEHEAHKPANDLITFGFIGRLAATKGVEVLIESFRRLHQTHKNVELIIAGDGDAAYRQTLVNLCQSLPVLFLGTVKPIDFYKRVDWTVLPSLWDEPLARVIFESFAHGIPVLASSTGGTPELVINDHTGHTYKDACNPDELCQLMSQVVECRNEYPSMSERCLLESRKYRPAKVAESYLSIYQNAASCRLEVENGK